MNIKMLKAAFSGMILSVSGFANAGLIEASYDFYITEIQGNTSLFDTWSDINSTDIFVGQLITAHIQIETLLAPADGDAPSNRYSSRHNGYSTIGAVNSRFLTTSMTINGNLFEPATIARPAGVQSPNSDTQYSGDANQWLFRELDSLGFTSLRTFDDWDTEFDDVLHDRQLSISMFGCDFADEIPLTNEELASCKASQTSTQFSSFSQTSGGSMWLRAGDGSLDDGSQNIGGFLFSAIKPVPEPSTLAIFALGIMGLASRRFKKQ